MFEEIAIREMHRSFTFAPNGQGYLERITDRRFVIRTDPFQDLINLSGAQGRASVRDDRTAKAVAMRGDRAGGQPHHDQGCGGGQRPLELWIDNHVHTLSIGEA